MTREQAQKARNILRRAIGHLVLSRSPQGHWGDIRSTALACWSLSEVLTYCSEDPASEGTHITAVVEDSRTWIAAQAKREEGGLSWESEAWDTSLAILALSPTLTHSERLDLATAWLRRISDPYTGSWYDEVWETTLAAAALLRRETLHMGPRNRDTTWLERTFRWLCTIPSKSSGEFVCPHYSGFLVWLRNEFQRAELADSIADRQILEEFFQKTNWAENWLLERGSQDGTALWSSYTFANSYILYALAIGSGFPRLQLPKVVSWYERRQGQHGGFEDIEDTALAVLALGVALSKSGVSLDLAISGLAAPLPLQHSNRLKCFIGYSDKSRALALELKDFMSEMLPKVEVKDWRWGFMPGHHLFAEIDTVSRECRLAIFLATKDDCLSYDDGTIRVSPRDNVIFEIGFFAARIGIENTILVVEEGTKIPTDLGGILHISLRDRRDLSHIKMQLLTTIHGILSDCFV